MSSFVTLLSSRFKSSHSDVQLAMFLRKNNACRTAGVLSVRGHKIDVTNSWCVICIALDRDAEDIFCAYFARTEEARDVSLIIPREKIPCSCADTPEEAMLRTLRPVVLSPWDVPWEKPWDVLLL